MGNALEHFAEQPPGVSDKDLEAMYFHIVAAEEPRALGEGSDPPDTRVWTAEDWFELPPEKMFSPPIGDSQPRNEDGEILGTAERLAVTAGAHANRQTPVGTWVWAAPGSTGPTFWMDASGTGQAVLVGKVTEKSETAAMRDLPGKDGYGRARGTEHIHRPSQSARVTALALHCTEIAEASGIEIVRETSETGPGDRQAQPGYDASPNLASYQDGGVRATLGPGNFSRPSTPDLVDEIAAITIARAWQHERADAEKAGGTRDRQDNNRIQRATIAGLIATDHLVQSAGMHTMTSEWGERVAKWVADIKQHGPEQAQAEIRRTVELTRRLEWDLRLPRNPRQIERGRKRAAARGDEEPAPVQAKSMPTFAAGHVNPAPPKAPGPIIGAAAEQNRKRTGPVPSR